MPGEADNSCTTPPHSHAHGEQTTRDQSTALYNLPHIGSKPYTAMQDFTCVAAAMARHQTLLLCRQCLYTDNILSLFIIIYSRLEYL